MENPIIYEEFRRASLMKQNLTPEDHEKFIPLVFNILPKMEEKDPVIMYEKIIEELKKHWTATDVLPVHGPWHHGLSAGIIINSLKNNGYNYSEVHIKEAMKRGLMIPAGACGFCGLCGAGSGLSIALSVINNVNPYSEEERVKLMKVNSEALRRIGAIKGARCCTRSTYTILRYAISVLKELGFNIPTNKKIDRCKSYKFNTQCVKNNCPYYPKPQIIS